MQLALQYAQLKTSVTRVLQIPHTYMDVPVSVEEIAGYLYCTERNVKILIRKMSEMGWIVWTPGRGRGHRSMIRFLVPAEDVLMAEAKIHVEQGNLNHAMSLFQMEGLDGSVMDRFLAWLGSYFGYKGNCDSGNPETLRLPMQIRVLTLDPVDVLFSRDLHFVKQAFDTLLYFNPLCGSLEPGLAHEWECNANATVWTFYLRKRVRFHHGRELTADDVVFSFNRLRSLGTEDSPNRWLLNSVKDIRAVDRLTVRMELAAPNYMLPHYVSSYQAAIVPADVYSATKVADASMLPVGTGPFRITRHDAGGVTLEAFEEYYKEGAHLDRIELLYVPDNVSDRRWQQLNFQMGKLNHYKQPAPAHWCKKEVMMLGSSTVVFNLRKNGPQQALEFRQAIQLILDRCGLIKELGLYHARPAADFLPTDSPGQGPMDHQPERARELLRECGYNGEPITMTFTLKNQPQAEWIQARCQEVGIPVILKLYTFEQMTKVPLLLEADVIIGGVVADDDEARCLIEMYKVGNLAVRVCATDEQRRVFDETIAAIENEPDRQARLERIRGMQDLVSKNFAVLFLLHTTQQLVYSPHLQGITFNTLGWFDFKNIWYHPGPVEE
ncbi:ABC transporter substrate-binding protein [Paenibacillus chondroitinus]|uniref:ABC transporter substrate-binding protein n=1 Tax=Paenibacillus chondroitinus TaxID=59842 RepID=A0ABU6DKE0_9BACL|nr:MULTISPECIES: ABC transporter substrate-binding protein [Paenibacillus]MCY9660436.1 ABC transporter substrate-binding protein [Paenibacillus anseongense]MEB4797448.1 ABC transporter substrate-binding protein [Paenibacillus chondroitinus]